MTDLFQLRPLIWMGSTQRDFRAMPAAVKSDMGYALYVAQRGGKHRNAKPLKGFSGAHRLCFEASSSSEQVLNF